MALYFYLCFNFFLCFLINLASFLLQIQNCVSSFFALISDCFSKFFSFSSSTKFHGWFFEEPKTTNIIFVNITIPIPIKKTLFHCSSVCCKKEKINRKIEKKNKTEKYAWGFIKLKWNNWYLNIWNL